MDQIKTGKLIAKLRKDKGMTQQELADIFGINYRSVSKWETGKTMPDISNIDLLSEIFGVTSDELLKGKLNTPHNPSPKKKNYKKYLLFLIPLIFIITAIIYFTTPKEDESETYVLYSIDKDDYYVEGTLTVHNNKSNIIINKVYFIDKEFNKIKISNYNYQLIYNNNILYTYGYDDIITSKKTISINDIKEITNSININYNDEIEIFNREIANNILNLRITFIDEYDNEITKNIEMDIVPKNNMETSTTQKVE